MIVGITGASAKTGATFTFLIVFLAFIKLLRSIGDFLGVIFFYNFGILRWISVAFYTLVSSLGVGSVVAEGIVFLCFANIYLTKSVFLVDYFGFSSSFSFISS